MSDAGQDQLFPDPVGLRLKAAREAKGLSLDDVASQTRIPIRHLQHIENGEWDALPAATYSVGFTRAYANAVGLNGAEYGAEVREQLGGSTAYAAPAASFYEPADPTRVPPRSLAIFAGVAALLLVIGYLVWRSGAVDDSGVEESRSAEVETALPEAKPVVRTPGPAQPVNANGPVVLTALNDVWLRIYEENGPSIYEGTLKTGERYQLPAGAKRPLILTGRPNAVRVTVGETEIPALGPAEKTIADVSLSPADLVARVQGQQAPAGALPTAR